MNYKTKRTANCAVVKYTDENDEVGRIECIIDAIGASGVGLRSVHGEWTNDELAFLEWPEPYGLDRNCTLMIDFAAKKYNGNLMLFMKK